MRRVRDTTLTVLPGMNREGYEEGGNGDVQRSDVLFRVVLDALNACPLR